MRHNRLQGLFSSIGVLTLLGAGLLLQSGPSQAAEEALKNPPAESDATQEVMPCEKGKDGVAQGTCYKHVWGSWGTDRQNYPQCTGGYVCNSPGAACVDATGTHHCTLSPSSGTCNCQCL